MRELIESVEGNFHQYSNLLRKIWDNPNLSDMNQHSPHLNELLKTLADIQDEVIDFRLKKIISEEHPYLPQIQIDKLKQNGPHSKQPLRQVVEYFLQQRRSLVKLLNALPEENWERTGVHEVEGHVSFKELVRRMIEKDRKILSELSQVLTQVPAS